MIAWSLRLRLMLIILVPLLLIAMLVGLWQMSAARRQAAELFDRSLLSSALAVSADVARSGGDALSFETRDTLKDAAGGPVFYHVYAPDGVFVTGYATPPVPVDRRMPEGDELQYYTGQYRGEEVRVLRFQTVTTIDGLSGAFTYTVWQSVATRNGLLRELAYRAFVVMAVLIGSVALVVWFGINLGLRPLLDLEDAISRRSTDDLGPIQRPVPREIRGLVQRLNALFGQVADTMEAQTVFISNAAHQLRNPIAGLLAMAEAVRSAPNTSAAQRRAGELVSSARKTGDLANKLLTLERAAAAPTAGELAPVDLGAIVADAVEMHRADAKAQGVALSADLPEEPVLAAADPVMLREALVNLVDNALQHGGPDLSRIEVQLTAQDGTAAVTVRDDGVGIRPEDAEIVLSRFGQAQPGQGAGLGLSIADVVAARHGGALTLDTGGPGVALHFSLPIAGAQRPTA